MSAGFGFSIGDILTVLKVVGIVINELQKSSSATITFQSTIDELYALETALLAVKRLDADITHVQQVALLQAAMQCQRTIDRFYRKVKKYQPHLHQAGTNSKVKDAWYKIIWTTCKQDDVDRFRAEIRGHTDSIKILLLATHMEATSLQAIRQNEQHKSLINNIRDFSYQVMTKLSSIAQGVAQTVQQGKALLDISTQIIQTNLRIFQIVHDIQILMLRIPGQVERQQPVYFLDPFNRETPFHLEFVQSKQALLAVLKINLEHTASGPAMIDRNEFLFEDRDTKRRINLSDSWNECFFPGQKVAMSMIFSIQDTARYQSCPSCDASQEVLVGRETLCTECSTTFRRSEFRRMPVESKSIDLLPDHARPVPIPQQYGPYKRRVENNRKAALQQFRRIQTVTLTNMRSLSESNTLSCSLCSRYGFQSTDRLRHHMKQNHSIYLRTYWVCVDGSNDKTFLSVCKSCSQKRCYETDTEAAQHLRQAHFNLRLDDGNLLDTKEDSWPSIEALRAGWLQEIQGHFGNLADWILDDKARRDLALGRVKCGSSETCPILSTLLNEI